MTLEDHFAYQHDHPPAPFNSQFRPGFREAVEREYGTYCELPTTPQDSGPSDERAAEYKAICVRLAPDYPTVEEQDTDK